MDAGPGPGSHSTASSDGSDQLDWHFLQCFGERTPGEEIQDGRHQNVEGAEQALLHFPWQCTWRRTASPYIWPHYCSNGPCWLGSFPKCHGCKRHQACNVALSIQQRQPMTEPNREHPHCQHSWQSQVLSAAARVVSFLCSHMQLTSSRQSSLMQADSIWPPETEGDELCCSSGLPSRM